MSKLKSHLSCLVDPATPEESKLKAAQEVSENLENIVNSQHYSSFLETAIPVFLQLLKEGESQFLADSIAQQVRKLVLDLIHRLPTNDQLKGHVKLLLSAMFSLLEIENEENVLVCLKVIIELHKQFRPSYSPEINKFMVFVKNIYTELPKTMTNALEPSEGEPQIGDSSETTKNPAVLPKASSSLKVLAELPIIVVLMYQLYKQTVHQWVAELIPLSIKTIILQPSDKARQSVNFNKEVYVDFVAVQIKFLSFLAYIIRVYQDQVNQYAHNVVQGMLALLKNCPQEVAHLRRELLIAARHILATDLRNRFISCIDQLFDEDLLIGCGWTTRETVRSLAYSILADLVHHIRANLTIGQLSQAVHLFSKNVHDDTLPVSIQTMSCKLLLNLVECIRQKGETDPSARDILMRMMEVFILKFQSIAEYQIPEIMERCQSTNELAIMQDLSPNGSQPGVVGGIGAGGGEKESARKMSLGSASIASFSFSSIFSSGANVTGSAASTYISVADCRGIVKTLVCGMKTITWGAKLPTPSSDFAASQKLFFPRETEVFVKLLKYGLVALDIYRVTVLPNGAHSLRNSNCQTVKTKEEKEVLEYFAGVYTMLSTSMFQEVFTDTVEYVVERVQSNYALQIIPNSFLANASTSAAFAGILLNFLLKHMDELGTNSDLSNLYLKMFKLVFGSVTLFAQENELMLKPHLHEIVNNSMQMAHIAREPCNYFLLLRALFRSIGGGSHELLYQEFLPLLSNLLQGLNRLQSAHHKQYMKDLFVELCLTVPVRLSSLLPYLHLLMDPLVSALNGSQTLVSQGLRTLELCVDNLQPDFLYEHIQPVRAQLMQALWQTLHNSDDSIAQVAFRVLGKFGGSNRKMLTSPQKLEYKETLIEGPCVSINFPDTESPVDLPVAKAIEIAMKMVKPSHSVESFYRQQAWQLLQAYLVSALNLSDADSDLYQLLKQIHFQPSEFSASRLKHISLPQCSNKVARSTFETALHGVFIASCLRELRNDAVVFLAGVVRLVTAIAVVQQCSSTNFLKQLSNDTMDVYVLLDAIAKCVSAEEKELCRIAELALTFMVDSACTIVGDRDKSSELPLFEVAADKLCGCCYERAWYTKSGGCWAIGFFMDKMPLKWVINHQLTFLMALLFVLHDLSEEVSSGTVLQAQKLIQQLITICNTPPEENKAAIEPLQAKAFHSVTRHLTKEVISPNENVRKQTHSTFQLLSEVTGKSLSSIIEPHKELLVDMIPPRKHLLKHQPINTQIALMDGYTFCSDLSPRLFSVNLTVQEHKIFFQELIALCEGEEAVLSKLPCYKSVHSLIPLKTSGLAALAACHYLTDMRERIFSVLYKAINSSTVQLQNAGKEAMRKFMADHSQSDIELVHSALRPLLMMLGDFRNLNPSLLTKLTHMVELFPTSFNEKMCESLLGHLRRWVEVLLQTAQTKINRRGEEVTVCLLIMGMFHMLPASTFRLFEHLLAVCIKAEKAVNTELGSPFRDPLLKFALKFPSQTVDYFLCRLSDPTISRVFKHFLKHKDGIPLKEVLEANSQKLLKATFGLQIQPVPGSEDAMVQKKQELQFQGVSLCYLLVESNEQWINDKTVVIDHLRKIWMLDSFHAKMSQDSLPLSHWQECVMLLKCLLTYCKSHQEDITLLFQLLRAFLTRHTTSFPFLKTYLENDIAKSYTINEKRQVFFKFVDIFPNPEYQQELKAKILQYILIPMFTTSFEDERGDELLGGPPDPEHDSDSNIISVFINRVINPDKPFGGTQDSVTILLLQFSSLLVEHAAPHIHDSNNKKQGAKLRRLMTFAWPCLLPKQCVDPATKYHGHLLLAHIIAKFAIHKRIVLQVFHSLLKAHAIEARSIVRQALEILTPVVPIRMEDANATLVHWTKKIIVEEGHTVAQLVHMLQLLCRHYRVYYPVRQHLVQHMVSSMQRLGLTSSATIEQRRLAVDLAEVVIKWEFQRAREAQEMEGDTMDHDRIMQDTSALGMKRSVSDGTVAAAAAAAVGGDSKRQRPQPQVADPTWPLDKQYADAVVNFLIRLACQVNDSQSTSIPGSPPSPGEALAKRCVTLVRTALKPDLWPYIEVKVAWFGKLFETLSQVDPTTGNGVSVHASACTALEVLTFLLISLPRPVILAGFKSLSRGLQLCMTCNNTKVVRYLHALLTRLMSMFPSEPASAMRSSKQEELEALYSSIPRIAAEGLTNYEKATNPSTTNLQCTIMILKAACNNDPTYIDRFLVLFVKVIQKLHKEHLTASSETQTISELLQLSLDMCKLRVSMMPQDCRKMFFSVVSSLIEKSPDAKLLKTITRIVDDWVKNRHDYPSHSGPSLREKTVLLSRMMAFYEKRFPDDLELNTLFLDIVHFVYRDEQLSATELTAKLEPAFLSGLRCPHIQIRNKFFEVFDASIQPRLFDRLLYIMCSQNWEHCGGHYWIKQCIELLLMVGMIDGPVRASTSSPLLPSITSIGPASTPLAPDVTEPPAITSQPPEELMEGMEGDSGEGGGVRALEKVANKLSVFLNECRNIQTRQFVTALSQLCHDNTQLAHIVWVDMLPKMWSALSERQRHALSGEVSPFMCSAAHLMQMECHPSAIGTFLQAVLRCRPIPEIRSCLLKYLGKTHNYWHGVALLLEERAGSEGELSLMLKEPPAYDGDYTDEILDPLKHETLDSLSELYSMLNEEDMWAGLWTLRCRFPETVTAISFELQGVYDQAQESYEQVMKKARELHNVGPAPSSVIPEYKLWEEHWCKCARELGQWETLTEFGKAHAGTNPFLVLENAWRVQDWTAMKEASTQAEPICTERYSAKLNLLRGFLALCYPDEQRLSAVEKLVEAASIQSVKHWRRLPSIVSHAHIPLLQLSQQIIELQEATQIQSGLQGGGLSRQGFQNEVKTIFKTWRNRLPNHFDDLSYWSDVFLWREHHFKCIVKAFDGSTHHGDQSNQSLLAVHNLASGITQFASIARKQKLVSVSLDSLSRIHSIPSVPVVDLFQKIRQQVKCYLMTSSVMEPTELQEALDFIESTNLKFFTKEMISEFMALKGAFLAQTGRSEEANKNFSAAVQLHDNLVKAWSLWGDFLEQLFTADRNITLGVAALTCFLHACRQQNEPKSRKYLAKTIWMLSYDDEKGTLAEALDKYYMGIPPMHWLPWIPQLLTCLIRNEGTHILNLLCSVGKAYPQAVYFPIRTLYLTLKMEQREKYKAEGLLTRSNSQSAPAKPSTAAATASEGVEPMQVDSAHQPAASETTTSTASQAAGSGTKSEGQSTQQSGKPAGTPQGDGPAESAPIRAPASLWRCSRIMHLLRDLHPTLLSALEGIVDQLIWFRESWYEDLLRQLNEGLALCYQVSFKNRTDVASTRITPELQQYVQKLVNSFGVSLEQSNAGGTLSQEALTKRAQIAAQDPTFQRLKAQFSGDFELSSPGPKRLNSLIAKLKRWIKILEMKTKSLYRSFLLEDRCRFLSNFSLSTADVEMPGEYLEPLPMPYYVRIARFMPRVEIVQKNSTNVRRLCIQGDNGKIYPYLVLNDATTASECRKEERVLQLFRLINHCLKKDKETCKRHLMFTLPKVVALSPQMRLAEDDVSAISLHDIFKQYTNEQGMEPDLIIIQFYERLGQLQSRGDKISLSTLKIMFTQLQQYFAPPTILRNWCERTCSSLTDFWTMRRQMMRQLALCGLAEYVFHLTRLDPEMLQVARNYGCLTQTFYRFEINGKGALDANRPVPFRLTPSLQTLFSPVGTRGPIQMSMIAITRCLVLPQFSIESLLFALLKDEFILWCKQEQEESEGSMVSSADVNNEAVIQRVTAAVEAITTRLYNLAEFETGQSQVSTIISAAASLDNICRMDPAWNPWL